MRRASHKRCATVFGSSQMPPGARNAATFADPLIGEQSLPLTDATAHMSRDASVERGAQQLALETAIYQRIESRLHGRVRNLLVRAFGGSVILEGQCATFYTKQLAQHAAMGILEDEHLENAIVVNASR